ncbi:TetR/AcrR family transcriptional regulator [Pectobacterium polaris]|uniref:TetR/AcrR family transcriptional regulator n=1 Tax=Pectobacterium polaris TaxID=2042057 RepID=UPI001CF1CFBF|nr:TetR/AcrR family transcriptional regulator [Pectobacterium polaris]MCA6939912.1 TetR/AcrR family transcriptional regulator [Pectobacterium polaris]MCA6955521.1 TetR/AcrR family transcriptional regulator [Pectobacterium polaris]
MAKKALKEQIALVAYELFRKNGYDKTTVEAIASATGMSTRTYFRYFPTKEDVLMEQTYAFRERFIEGFTEKLDSEDIWEAMKNLLTEYALNCAGTQEEEIQAFIRATPALVTRQFVIFEALLSEATDLYMSQHRNDLSWHTVNAFIRSAFSCLQAIQGRQPEKISYKAFNDLMMEMRPVLLTQPR